MRTPGLFEDVDVGEGAWRERVEVQGGDEEVGRAEDGERMVEEWRRGLICWRTKGV